MREPREVINVRSLVEDAIRRNAQPAAKADEFAQPRIVVIGCGGAGNNMVNRIAQMGIKGAELIAINTDKQHLSMLSDDITKILIGGSVTRGLGAGGNPEVGQKAAEVSRQALETALEGADLVFVLAGLGGGTGTGSAPVVAQIAKEQGAIVVAMVTYPFRLERARMNNADEGLVRLAQHANTVIVIDNNRLVELVPNLPLNDALKVADEVIAKTIQGLAETITQPSVFKNIDFADIRAIMTGGGLSVISVGEGRGVNKVQDVVEDTLKNALLDVDVTGATGVLIHITGGSDLTLGEAADIGELLTERVDPKATVVWGARIDPSFQDRVRVIAIFTGVSSNFIKGPIGNSSAARDIAGMAEEIPGLDYLR
ncbi:MAG: cell division protein FtsZ [Candidatus Diapherotrites archaeon]|nr:cell division protein FtsZ [Candidatus Diapherotrites archaeon]